DDDALSRGARRVRDARERAMADPRTRRDERELGRRANALAERIVERDQREPVAGHDRAVAATSALEAPSDRPEGEAEVEDRSEVDLRRARAARHRRARAGVRAFAACRARVAAERAAESEEEEG